MAAATTEDKVPAGVEVPDATTDVGMSTAATEAEVPATPAYAPSTATRVETSAENSEGEAPPPAMRTSYVLPAEIPSEVKAPAEDEIPATAEVAEVPPGGFHAAPAEVQASVPTETKDRMPAVCRPPSYLLPPLEANAPAEVEVPVPGEAPAAPAEVQVPTKAEVGGRAPVTTTEVKVKVPAASHEPSPRAMSGPRAVHELFLGQAKLRAPGIGPVTHSQPLG